MKIDIISDTICPWCFIGKRKLESAIKQRPQTRIEIRWQAFFLNPDMPEGGMDRQDYVNRKFGGSVRAKEIYDRITTVGKTVDIAFRFDLITRTPNTTRSHRLIHYADQWNCQDMVVEELFRRYFLEGQDIGDLEVLTEAAAAAGLDRNDTTAYLQSNADRQLVVASDQNARSLGISGVPFFVFENKYAVSGAQSSELFLQTIDRIEQEAMTTAS